MYDYINSGLSQRLLCTILCIMMDHFLPCMIFIPSSYELLYFYYFFGLGCYVFTLNYSLQIYLTEVWNSFNWGPKTLRWALSSVLVFLAGFIPSYPSLHWFLVVHLFKWEFLSVFSHVKCLISWIMWLYFIPLFWEIFFPKITFLEYIEYIFLFF